MDKKNKADFIDEEEFLSAVSMNKKGGCVRMGKPPQETDNTPHETVPSEDNETLSQDQNDVSSPPQRSKEASPSKRTAKQSAQGSALGKLRGGNENIQRKPAYIRLDNHNRFTVAAGVYKVTLGQIVDSILDEWWEKNRDEVKNLYDRDRNVFEDN